MNPPLHSRPELGCIDIKRWILETHLQKVSFGEVLDILDLEKAEDLHYLELAKDENGNEICWSIFLMGKKRR